MIAKEGHDRVEGFATKEPIPFRVLLWLIFAAFLVWLGPYLIEWAFHV